MRILLVEDEFVQEEAIRDAILDEFPDMEIDVIRTESEFRKRLGAVVKQPPDIIIMDGMIRWTDPSPEMENAPDDVREGGSFRAGRRCQQLITERLPGVTLFFHTILDREDLDEEGLPKDICYLPKKDDPQRLIEKIRKIVQRSESR